ncbi:FtsX-like permease family protein [Leptobacterium flavescens]|uniref:FtsX-like permease family protein n=1 Tax=Leptobacterium flavescens TaxID=472055 RepID=A0A6P0ULY1_9FLAO|nr:ABC transporter permease [Leptobacterium flavescens]NER14244.1 FtsX-like permease family protein [Leptobacterium flavescens]
MYFPFYIAKRYLFSKSSQNAVNIINWVTFFVIVIGTASLFIVLSGFSGLKSFDLSFSNSFDPDMKITASTGKFFTVDSLQEKELKKIEGIASFSREIEERVFLSYKQKNDVAYVKGVDHKYNGVTQIDSLIFFGNWFNQSKEVVVGYGISIDLGLSVNDYVNSLSVIVPKLGKGSILNQARPFKELLVSASGVYSLSEDIDDKYVFAPIGTVQELLQKNPDEITGINIRMQPGASEDRIRSSVEEIFGNKVDIRNREQLNSSLYKMLNTENLATYLIFTLVLIIALFNVAGAIIMMILDKKDNLTTLFNMGATVRELKRIFFIQGILLVVIGGLSGLALGILITWLQTTFSLIMITPSLAYPMELKLMNALVVILTIFILGFIAAKISSVRISRKLISQ